MKWSVGIKKANSERGEMMDKKGLTINVSVTDTKLFADMVGILTDLFNDDRIERSAKDQYSARIEEVVENSGYYLERK